MTASYSLPGLLHLLYHLKNSFLYLSYRFLDFFFYIKSDVFTSASQTTSYPVPEQVPE